MADAPRYLALDIGTHTGWGIVEGSRIVQSGVRDFSVKSTEHIGKRGIKFANFLTSLGHFDEIYFEKIQFTGKYNVSDGGELYKGFMMLLNMHCYSFGIHAFGVWPGTLKKNFTGDGHAKKEQMCAQAHALGWKGGLPGTAFCDDEADALALLLTELPRRYGLKIIF